MKMGNNYWNSPKRYKFGNSGQIVHFLLHVTHFVWSMKYLFFPFFILPLIVLHHLFQDINWFGFLLLPATPALSRACPCSAKLSVEAEVPGLKESSCSSPCSSSTWSSSKSSSSSRETSWVLGIWKHIITRKFSITVVTQASLSVKTWISKSLYKFYYCKCKNIVHKVKYVPPCFHDMLQDNLLCAPYFYF